MSRRSLIQAAGVSPLLAQTEILQAMFRVGLLELHVHPPACVSKAGEYPAASALARCQAQHGQAVTTMRHTMVEAMATSREACCACLTALGTAPPLATELAPMIHPAPSPSELMAELDKNLSKLARFGLLVA